MGLLDRFRKKKEEPTKEEPTKEEPTKEEPTKEEPQKCRNCNKELEDGGGEFCSKECEDLYYDLYKSK